MKNVVLIGDSVRANYKDLVKKTFEDKVDICFRDRNYRNCTYLFRYLHEDQWVIKQGRVDVVYWNTGIGDCTYLFGEDEPHTPIEIYKYYIDRCCIRFKKFYPHAKIIFATSTSVCPELIPSECKCENKDIEAYNAAAVEIVKKHGFEVDDLYSVTKQLPKEAYSDFMHFDTKLGRETLTNAVVSTLSKALELDEVLQYKE